MGQSNTNDSTPNPPNITTTITNTPTTTTTPKTTIAPTHHTPINMPRAQTEEKMYPNDLRLQVLTGAYRTLSSRYEDTAQGNASTHLGGGIKDDAHQQHLYNRVTDFNLPLWEVPSIVEGDFLLIFTQLLQDVRERKCNSKKALLFAPCILHKTRGKKHLGGNKTVNQRKP